MQAKLTLSLEKKVIDRAKSYAREKRVSVSFLVENYLQKLVSEYKPDPEMGNSVVEELSGIISLPPDYDFKGDYADYLAKKHS